MSSVVEVSLPGPATPSPRPLPAAPRRAERLAPLARRAACLPVLALAFADLAASPRSLVLGLALAALVTAALTLHVVRREASRAPFRRAFAPGVDALLVGFGLAATSLAITARSIAALPPRRLTLSSLPLLHLAPVLLAVFLGTVLLAARALASPDPARALALASLTTVVLHSTLNGDLHGLLGTTRAPLLFSLTVLAGAAVLATPRRQLPRAAWGLALSFLGIAIAASILGFDPQEGLVRTAALAHWVSVLGLLASGLSGRREVRFVLSAMLATAAAVALSALVSAAEMAIALGPSSLLSVQLRMARTNPNGSGLYAAVTLVLCFGALETWGRHRLARRLLVAVGVVLSAALLLCYSKAAALSLALGLVALAVLRRGAGHKRGAFPRLAWGIALAALAALGSVLERDPEPGLSSRLVLWKQAARIVSERPLLGIGLGDAYPTAFNVLMPEADLARVKTWFARTHPHDLVLAVAVGTGLSGLALFLALSVSAGRRLAGFARRGSGASAALVATFLAALVAWAADHLGVLVLSEKSLVGEAYFVLLGLAFALLPRRATLPHSAVSARLLGAFLLVTATLLAVPADRWKRATPLRPHDAAPADRAGWLAWLDGDEGGARRAFEKAIRLDTAAVEGGPYQAHLAYLELRRGDRARGVELLREASRRSLRFAAEDWFPDAERTDLFLDSGFAPGASHADLRRALLRHVGRAEASSSETGAPSTERVGLSSTVLGGLALAPPDVRDGPILSSLFEIYRTHGLDGRSAEVVDVAESRFGPKEPLVLAMRARLLRLRGRSLEAAASLDRLLVTHAHPRLRFDLAETLSAGGDAPRAAREIRTILANRASLSLTSPFGADAWLTMSRILEEGGDLEAARDAARRAAFTSPEAATYDRARAAVRRLEEPRLRSGSKSVYPPPPSGLRP